LDTRWLTRRLRDGGTQKAALSTCGTSVAQLQEMIHAWPGLDGRDVVREVTCPAPYEWPGDAGSAWVAPLDLPDHPAYHIVAYDFGIKKNILRHLASGGAA
jgi:carbamoyl-phosphate synthase small subunit